MDYRYYRGDGFKLSDKWRKYLHRLRYVGIFLMVIGVVLPWLMVLHMLESTFLWNMIASLGTVVGMILFVVGMIFDNLIDRSD